MTPTEKATPKSEVVKEIFEQVDTLIIEYLDGLYNTREFMDIFLNLKKKYTEEESQTDSAQWILKNEAGAVRTKEMVYVCSKCGERTLKHGTEKYCSECGARMDGGKLNK